MNILKRLFNKDHHIKIADPRRHTFRHLLTAAFRLVSARYAHVTSSTCGEKTHHPLKTRNYRAKAWSAPMATCVARLCFSAVNR